MHAGMLDHKRTRFQRKGRSIMERPDPCADMDGRAAEGAGVLSWQKKGRSYFDGHILLLSKRRIRVLEREEVLHI